MTPTEHYIKELFPKLAPPDVQSLTTILCETGLKLADDVGAASYDSLSDHNIKKIKDFLRQKLNPLLAGFLEIAPEIKCYTSDIFYLPPLLVDDAASFFKDWIKPIPLDHRGLSHFRSLGYFPYKFSDEIKDLLVFYNALKDSRKLLGEYRSFVNYTLIPQRYSVHIKDYNSQLQRVCALAQSFYVQGLSLLQLAEKTRELHALYGEIKIKADRSLESFKKCFEWLADKVNAFLSTPSQLYTPLASDYFGQPLHLPNIVRYPVASEIYTPAPAQGYLVAPAQGYPAAPAQGYLAAPAQGYPAVPAYYGFFPQQPLVHTSAPAPAPAPAPFYPSRPI
ncbi:MAG: hypothetical protein K0S08_1744 [Gammaproteobacteria bacterium]|jgi:hypothetical protein|nr:hypothetical protein [Gammaproteobacteria bacterium]